MFKHKKDVTTLSVDELEKLATKGHKEAKKEYENIVGESNFFYSLGYKNGIEPIEFELTGLGHKEIVKASKAKMTTASAISVGEARGHG